MSCLNCIHAKFQRTATGRIMQKIPGRCTAPDPIIPNHPCVMTVTVERRCVWPDDGAGCPVYAKGAPK